MDEVQAPDHITQPQSLHLAKPKAGGRRSSAFILGTQLFATMSYFGVSSNLVLYLSKIFNEENAVAANNSSNWVGTSYMVSFLGAFLGDAYWGRYWTTGISLTIFLVGTTLLTLTASLRSMKYNPISYSYPKATRTENCFLYISLYIMALGSGAYRPCLTSFGADQFDRDDAIEQAQATSFLSWLYMSFSLGAIIAGTLVTYVQDNVSFRVGYGICTMAVAIAVVIFFAGTPFYRHEVVGENPLTRVAQVFVAVIFKLNIKVPYEENLLYELDDNDNVYQWSCKLQHTNEFRLFDKAATKVDAMEDIKANPWRLCTVTQVEEVKCIIRMLPIWATNIFFSIVYSQMTTLFVEQGATMKTNVGRFKIPPATLTTITMATVLICTPMYKWWVIPMGRIITKKQQGFTDLQRMGIGMVIIVIAMVCAALVETFRLRIANDNGLLEPMGIFWQLPQYILVGITDVFTFIGQLNFFYNQSPNAIKGMGVALSLSSFALGNYFTTILLSIVMRITSTTKGTGWISNNLDNGHMDYFYWLLAVLSIINFLFYLQCANWYKCITIDNIQSSERTDNIIQA